MDNTPLLTVTVGLMDIILHGTAIRVSRAITLIQVDNSREDLCNKYGSLAGIHMPCDQLAHGTQLTQECRTGLARLFSGGLGLLSGVNNPLILPR